MERRRMAVYCARDFCIKELGRDEEPKWVFADPQGLATDCICMFRAIRVNKNGNIAWLNDIGTPTKQLMKELEKDDRFLEVCDFVFYNFYTSKIIDVWSGTFIDALVWLDTYFYEIQREGEGL